MNPDLLPIIVGVGQVNDRHANPLDGRDPVALMAEALRLAEADAGVDLLTAADTLGVVRQISFPEIEDASILLAARLRIAPARAFQTPVPHGESPVMLLNDAANRIGVGEVRIALVCGGEALRTAAAQVAADQGGRKAELMRESAHRVKTGHSQDYGLVAPVDVYPLYENAMRAQFGQSFVEAQAESAGIWALFSQVAADNPAAWLRQPVSAEEIATPSERNRPIAFPYSKLMVANSAVNQGAGFIVTSVGEARARGIPEAKWIYVGNGAAAHEDTDWLARDRYSRSVSMEVSLHHALELNGIAAADLAAVELYSCFPCIPKLARRVIDWPLDRPASVVGGLTFGGGPIGNYMSHAVAAMTLKLRASGGTGLLFGNGGYGTHNHSIVVSSQPIAAASFPRSYDYQAEAEALRDPIPAIARDWCGPATIETYTVFHHRDGSVRSGVVVARTPQGDRALAHVPGSDAATLARLMDPAAEPVGMAGEILAGQPLRLWRFA